MGIRRVQNVNSIPSIKRGGGLEVRKDQVCEIVTEHSLVIKLAALFVGYLNLRGRTSQYNHLANI